MTAATQTGVDNGEYFLSVVSDMGEEGDLDTVKSYLVDNDWQKVVDYAKTYSYYNSAKSRLLLRMSMPA
jgi:hypothetical protein